jgi:hypothetical protein
VLFIVISTTYFPFRPQFQEEILPGLEERGERDTLLPSIGLYTLTSSNLGRYFVEPKCNIVIMKVEKDFV